MGHVSLSVLALLATVVGASVVFAWRVRESTRPISLPKIIMPPLGMSTGFGMFFYPPTRIPFTWGLGAFLVGFLLLALPLVHTSRLHVHEGRIHMKRNRIFLWVLLGLVIVRLALRGWVEQYITVFQTGALFFTLAFGMVLRWRLSMLREFLHLRKGLAE